MNVTLLIQLAAAANTIASVVLLPRNAGVEVRWTWDDGDETASRMIVLPATCLEADRHPFFAARNYLQMAAEAMAQEGGKPDRQHNLFCGAEEIMSYAQQRDLLEVKFGAGRISSQQYVDGMLELIQRRDRDKAFWPNGANRR